MGKKMKPKVHVRDSIVDFLLRTEKFIAGDAPADENIVKGRLEKLEKKWDEFEEIQCEIEDSEEHGNNIEAHRQVRANFEEKYFEVRAGLMAKLPRALTQHELQTSALPPTNTLHASVRLPQINLPEFNGNYENWLPFHDTFRALIDSSNELSNIQKFHYLRASLKGDALKLVDSFPMSDANYRVAWDGLVARFSNSYLLKKRHLNALLEYPKMKRESAAGIHDIIDCFERNTKILDQLGEKTAGWGAMLTHLMVSKLDDSTQKQWEEHATQHDDPSFPLLVGFLKKQTRVLDAVSVDQRITGSAGPPNIVKFRPTKITVNSATEHAGPSCVSCGQQHFIIRCPIFSKLPLDKRLKLTNSKRLCSNCLGRNHLARDCPSKFRCKTCSKKHHSLLHPGFPGSGSSAVSAANVGDHIPTPSSSGDSSSSGDLISSSVVSISSNVAVESAESHVFLLTALVNIKDSSGRTHSARALLDSGSQANLMSKRLSQLLKLPLHDKHVEICGIGQARHQTAHEVSTEITSRVNNYSLRLNFLILDRVTDNQPNTSFNVSRCNLPSWMKLADPDFHNSGPVDMVLGSQHFYNFHLLNGRLQVRKFGKNNPVFVNTVFGWVAAGEALGYHSSSIVSCNMTTTETLERTIEKFWIVEEIPKCTPRSQEEEDCEVHFRNTVSRDETGRYIVRYPKKMNYNELIGESRAAALRRFHQLERRLEHDPDLQQHYNDFMKEYLELGHMLPLNNIDEIPELEQKVCYLPHHPVFKTASTTTKVRVVFDGSAKTATTHSLNEALLTGPVIQDELIDLMLRFRKHPVALVADVEKMYRQIRIHSEDAHLQRILWRFNSRGPITVYELQTVTYGLSPSSFLATRVLHQLADDCGNKYPLAATALKEDFYMDDFLSGAESTELAKRLRNETQSLLQEGGFRLRKWNSNEPEILADLPQDSIETSSWLHFEPEPRVKTLGVVWDTKRDHLCIEVREAVDHVVWTKRTVFSVIAQLYDPLGLVSPVIIWAKIQMQHLWLASVEWDEPIPDQLEGRWREFFLQLPYLRHFSVPRFIFASSWVNIQLHVFCDASEAGYGACIYARSTGRDRYCTTKLVAAKSRVAPLKRLSLPRLELCAALLGAKLYARVSAALRMEGIPCWFWTDSMVTLHWIRAPPNTWQTFVGNRTSEIQQITHGHKWNHVKGIDNPADHVSRGLLPKQLMDDPIWQSGPTWLAKSQDEWPQADNSIPPPEDTLERRKVVNVVQEVPESCFLFKLYSSFWRLVRVTAYIQRFMSNCRQKGGRNLHRWLTVSELKQAKETLVKCAQTERFVEELKALMNNKPVPSNSSLKLLHPFIDHQGILRVGGRLEQSPENYQTKHPIIVPSKHPLSRLIATHYHIETFHSGPRMTLASIRQEFWPIGGKALVNFVYRNCVQCFRHNPVPSIQPVGQLPKARVVPSRPFTITGVDYCGPVYLKPVHRRAASQKAYIAVFVCFATKALHLELVCDLSTEAFIAALRRFIARRGLPAEIHSDNGKNFQGAKNTLAELFHLLNNDKHKQAVLTDCTNRGITWNFIPPRAPNFGGLWEAAVKSTKTSIVKTLGNAKLSYEDYATLLAQVEANLNTRPLTPLSEDPNELNVLTPGHFLTGQSLSSIPDPDYTNTEINRLKHYHQLQKLIQDHWIRWKKEYLTELNSPRRKQLTQMDIVPGQMVLVQDDTKSTFSWPLARILDVHPGEDGVVRVVTIKTSSGIYRRPVSKVFILPFDRMLAKHQADENSALEDTQNSR